MKSLLVYREAMVVPAAIGKMSHPPNMVSKPTPNAVRIKRSRLVKQNPVATGCITTVILLMGATITRRITMLAREDYLFLLVRVDLSTSQAYPFSDLTGCIILVNKFMEEKNGKRKMQKLSDEELLNVTGGGGEKGSDTDRCSGLSHQNGMYPNIWLQMGGQKFSLLFEKKVPGNRSTDGNVYKCIGYTLINLPVVAYLQTAGGKECHTAS